MVGCFFVPVQTGGVGCFFVPVQTGGIEPPHQRY